ncbi:hypothetical protein CcaCcLH18_05032 [Colletotrichum camelliae]|nr:hypothetical protein CcaCcLH18_05032 [Colletotrichum camelliae]
MKAGQQHPSESANLATFDRMSDKVPRAARDAEMDPRMIELTQFQQELHRDHFDKLVAATYKMQCDKMELDGLKQEALRLIQKMKGFKSHPDTSKRIAKEMQEAAKKDLL